MTATKNKIPLLIFKIILVIAWNNLVTGKLNILNLVIISIKVLWIYALKLVIIKYIFLLKICGD